MSTADTIPIKCPGCQAGFDVPVGLAGKTIRCTSCKTQLPVPAPRSAPVAKAASANGNGKAKSVGDLLPTAKSAPRSSGPPPRSAGAAPKGRAIRDDDDDDDDDEDEDDRPARPRKGKKSSGGAPVALIAAVVGVLVLGGGGAAAYFVFAKNKPAETAAGGSSGDSSGGAAKSPSDMIPKGAPRGGAAAGGGEAGASDEAARGGEAAGGGGGDSTPTPAAGPGPTGSGTPRREPGTAASDGWVTHKGSGFTIEFPADVRPVQLAFPPGNATFAAGLADSEDQNKAGLIALSVSFPPAVRSLQPKAILDLFVQGLSKGGNGPLGRIKINVTNKVETEVDGFPAYDLTLTPEGKSFDMFARVVAVNGRLIVAACGHESDPRFASLAPRFRGSLRIDAGPVAALPPMGESPTRPGAPGRGSPSRGGEGAVTDAPAPTGEGPTRGTPPPAFPMPMGEGPGRKPTPMAGIDGQPERGTPGGMPTPTPGATPPTFPMPGSPPPAFPMPGSPPPAFPTPGGGEGQPPAFPPPGTPFPAPGGGEQGFGGSGGFVVPALAGQVQPFFAIAFDTEKGEVYTVSPRQAGAKWGGTLYRYSYPEFLYKGEWKLPRFGTRAVIDTKTEKLYLATAPSTLTPLVLKALVDQKNDRAATTGDVDVIDLAALRGGKVESRTDVKTAATFSFTAPIRGLDVSADGKTLTVLVSRQPVGGKQGKATIKQYDTAERKLVKDKDLPNPAWDMTRSADGKALLVTEFPSDRQALLAYDPATLERKDLTLPQGMVSDVAPGPAGRFVAAVGATAGSPGKLMLIDGAGAPQEIPTAGGRASQNGYARFTPDGKKLLVTSHGLAPGGMAPGLDIYDVSDPAAAAGYKKVATVRSAGTLLVGGNLHIAPDGQRVVFQTGAVLATDKMTEHTGAPEAPGVNGNGNNGAPGFPAGGGPGFPGGEGGAPMPAPGGIGGRPMGMFGNLGGQPGGMPPGSRPGPGGVQPQPGGGTPPGPGGTPPGPGGGMPPGPGVVQPQPGGTPPGPGGTPPGPGGGAPAPMPMPLNDGRRPAN